MDDEADIYIKINIPTDELHLAVIQELLQRARTNRTQDESSQWDQILQVLWTHLQTGLKRFDDQLLCATGFYTILEYSNQKIFYINKVLILIDHELAVRDKNKDDKDLSKELKTLQVVSLMYGLMQSTFTVHVDHKSIPEVENVLKSTLNLLIIMAYEYSRYTFIVFKTLSSLRKICGTDLQEIIFSKNELINILNLVNHNWENPITGVRDLNKTIFNFLIMMLDDDGSKMMLNEINKFYWNKAKFLMLAEIIDQSTVRIVDFVLDHEWTDGLIYSLHKTGLVSAGADMYYAVLKKIKTEEEWCALFINRFIDILHGNNTKAIENFCNYWCLTTLKKFPYVADIIIAELETLEDSEFKLYSSLCILKQANKLGLINKNQNINNYNFVGNNILKGIEGCNPHARMMAFEVVSVTQGKSMPSLTEYTLILNYLQNNINSDCTVLRISMLGNVKYFLINLCASYVNFTKNTQMCESHDVQNFCKRLQECLIDSLNLAGNYQRKLTTIKLCNIFLSSLTELPKKRQKQTTNFGKEMFRFLKERDCLLLFGERIIKKLFSLLKDPSDDIRENVVQLLLDHYSKEITPTLLNHLIEDAQDCIRSKFFYQISCGQSLFRLITSLILKEKFEETIFESVDDVFCYAYNVLRSENELKTDIVKSIEDGKQLHAYISILLEVLKISRQNLHTLKNLKEIIPQLLEILEAVSNQFAWESDPAVSSDFSKMSDMVQDIIAASGYNPFDVKDQAKISGLQQIVLNSLWLNVKSSCDLAFYLMHFLDNNDTEACERCLTIVTHVLETSRHKGAIEAAGSALGHAVQYLTSLPRESALSKIPLSLLKSKLKELISCNSSTSITRRGAGLSIMVHRIVSNDMEKGKPLFHYFMESLLQACASRAPLTVDAGQKDVPRAVYIHFLTKVVTDSGLASDMMYYSAALAGVAFDNLTSPQWQIRNAALQLYGALIPKLIGQRKASGANDETVATVACDEFRTHSPQLWRHMQQCLQNLDDKDKVESHSNVLPTLNVLANLAKRYNFASDKTTLDDSEQNMLASLMTLLGSPIYTVRRLTAKCIFNIYEFETVFKIIMKQTTFSENLFHGSLILTVNYRKHLSEINEKDFNVLLDKFKKIINLGSHSYISRKVFDDLFTEIYNIQNALLHAKQNKHSPGVFHWVNNILQKHVKACPWEEIPNILIIFLKEKDFEHYCEYIYVKLESDPNIPEEILKEIGKTLLSFENKLISSITWKMLYHISAQIDLGSNDVSILSHLQNEVPYKIRYAVPFLASIAAKLSNDNLLTLSSIIFSLCDPDKSDVDMRYIAALANNELAKVFSKIPDTVKLSAIKCAVLLLQDEDEDVRMMNIHFYANLKKDQTMLHSYVCLNKILNGSFLNTYLDDAKTGIPIICAELTEIMTTYTKSGAIDEYNPFSSDSKNIYFEAEVVKNLISILRSNLE